ncbi:hypothetical protein L3Q82_023072 [Scortum barcoo]|uniref:Uncharacterized protein n=1 Tax=Scortum barcoo TaxID=214431 RepID=A0ACB8WXZ3_9TELE|nr:hypothetical protein L3Q82_023072 [Scortum barcoo]
MSWLKCSRIVCSSLRPKWLLTSPQPVCKAVTCSAHCVSTKRDTWHRDFRALGVEGEPSHCPNLVSSARSYCTGQVELKCWNCREPLEETPAFFCQSCKVVQPPEEGASFFKMMGCDCTFTLDAQELQKRYLQLQRSLHPDNFSQKSVKEQEFSESQSALVNKAYKTLLKPLSRGLYMLELQGMHIEEGTDSGADSVFLMELMEINEALDEARTPEEADKIGRDTKGKQCVCSVRKLADLTKEIDAALVKVQLPYHTADTANNNAFDMFAAYGSLNDKSLMDGLNFSLSNMQYSNQQFQPVMAN